MTTKNLSTEEKRAAHGLALWEATRAAATQHAELASAAKAVNTETADLGAAVVALLNEIARPCLPLVEGAALIFQGGARVLIWTAARLELATGVLRCTAAAVAIEHDAEGYPTSNEADAAIAAAYAEAAPLRPQPPAPPTCATVPNIGESWRDYLERRDVGAMPAVYEHPELDSLVPGECSFNLPERFWSGTAWLLPTRA